MGYGKFGTFGDATPFFDQIFHNKELRSNKELVLKAVAESSDTLKLASEALKHDKEVVMTAVKRDGGSLKDASYALQDDEEVVRAALKQDAYALKFASPRLKKMVRDAFSKGDKSWYGK